MRVVIIGANGQLGSDCCAILPKENETIGCDIPRVDIGSQESVDNYLNEKQPDVIVNCAAYTAVDNCETEIELCWKVNSDGPKNLAIGAERLGSRLIHVSTDYVFDGHKPVPGAYSETAATNPLSEYGKSKLQGEKNIVAHCENHVILRTAWLYSAWGGNFLKTMLRLALGGPERELKVVNDQFGSLTWSYTLALQIEKLLDSELNGVIHATSDGHSSWYEAARYFLDAMGVEYKMAPCTTAEYPTPAHRPANSILENKVLDDAKISSFNSWQQDIDTFVEQYKNQLLEEARG